MHLPTVARTLVALFIVTGMVTAMQPQLLVAMLRFGITGRVPYVIAVLRVCIGVLFVWVGGRLHSRFVGFIGALVIVVGILGLVVKLETQKRLANSIINSSEMTHRLIGVGAAVLGSIIFFNLWPRY
jgi:uncharacterized protein YjeT (DUF2065 family)